MSPSESDNDQVSEHLGRLLSHADELLDEWREYSVKLRAELDGQAERAGKAAGEAMRRSLTELSEAGDELEDLSQSLQKARAGARGLSGVRGPWIAVLLVQLLIGGVLVALIMKSDAQPAPMAPTDAAPIADAAPPPDAPAPDAAAPPPPLCGGLLRGASKPTALGLIRACAVIACDFDPPSRDRGNRALRGVLAKCKPERDGALVQELLQILASRKALARCQLAPGDDGSFAVDSAFVASCRGEAGK